MRRLLTVGFVVVTFSIWTAIAQVATTGTGTGTTGVTNANASLAGNSSTTNLRTANDRNPGRRVQTALSRHREITDARVNAARGGGNDNRNSNSSTGGTGTGTTTDSTGGLGDLLGLLGGLGGTTGTGTTGGTSGLGADINALISLAQAAGIDISGLLGSLGGATAQTRQPASANVDDMSVERLMQLRQEITNRSNVLDPTNRSQTSTTDRSFRLRLADRMTTTVFTALNLAVRQRFVIDAIKDGLRPLFPNLQNTDNSNGNSNSSSNSNVNVNSNGSSGGGTVDDVTPPNANGNSNSLV